MGRVTLKISEDQIMTDLKPLPCPLLPGVEPRVSVYWARRELHFVWCSRGSVIGEGRYLRTADHQTEAEAIAAWNQWMQEVQRG